MQLSEIPLKGRFEENILRTQGCWFWTGKKNHSRANITVYEDNKRISRSVRRVSWELFTGEKLEHDMMVKTSCMESLCVNPDHLYLVLRTYSWKS